MPYCGPFDGFKETQTRASKFCLVSFDRNRYSVDASAANQAVSVHAYADRVVIRRDGQVVGEHPRVFGRDRIVFEPRHYVPVLGRKPGALRNGAPFRDGEPPDRKGLQAGGMAAPSARRRDVSWMQSRRVGLRARRASKSRA
jgi:hypothetical protein